MFKKLNFLRILVTKIETNMKILRGILETTIAEGKLDGKILISVKKSSGIDRTRAVDIPTYSVFSESPSGLRDRSQKKTSFFFDICQLWAGHL